MKGPLGLGSELQTVDLKPPWAEKSLKPRRWLW